MISDNFTKREVLKLYKLFVMSWVFKIKSREIENIVKIINVYIGNKSFQNSLKSFYWYAWSPKKQKRLIWKNRITDSSWNIDIKYITYETCQRYYK